MNKLTRTLLGGAALSALTAAPSIAQPAHPAFRITALHEGHAVNKTKVRKDGANDCSRSTTYCYSVYSYQPASAPKKTHLIYTFYKFNSTISGQLSICTNPKTKNRAPKKSIYAKIGTATETYSEGCTNGVQPVFYGDTWTNKTGVAGETDRFRSLLIGHFKADGKKYRGQFGMTVNVFIE